MSPTLRPATVKLAALAAAGLLVLAGPARAELGAGLGLVSDDRYRGASLSDGRPAFDVSLSYDHPGGLYAGGKLIVAAPGGGQGPEPVGYMDYAGFVMRRGLGPALDIGAVNYHLTRYRVRKRTIDYTEAYVGLVGRRFNTHLYYAPDYYRSGSRTLYADVGAGLPVTSSLRLFGHGGVLAPVGGRRGPRWRKVRYDVKAGAALDIHGAELSLSWTGVTSSYVARSAGGEDPQKLAVGLSFLF